MQALKSAREFEYPECEGVKCPKLARQSTPTTTHLTLKMVHMDVKQLPGWMPTQRIKCLNVVDDTGSLQMVGPLEMSATETSRVLLQALQQAWIRPYMRPTWLKVDPHRAQVSVEFLGWCERRGIQVIDTAGEVTEQNGKVEHQGQMFEMMLEDALREVQPQTEAEWRTCMTELLERRTL